MASLTSEPLSRITPAVGILTSLALACPPSAPVYHHAQQASSAPQQQIHGTTHATALGNALPADCVGPPQTTQTERDFGRHLSSQPWPAKD